jgi:DNA repair exonuclease SbcCD nuclease subunit
MCLPEIDVAEPMRARRSRKGAAVVRFVHTADWQLGFHRGFLDDDAQARFTQARIDVIGSIGDVVREHAAEFVVVAGDVFDSNQVDRRTVHRALDQLAAVPVPVCLLPGNHDALDAASIYRSASFLDRCPDNVVVLADRRPRRIIDDAEVIGVPWTSNELLLDAVGECVDELPPAEPGSPVTRIMVAHGIVDALMVDRHTPGAIDTGRVEAALADERLAFLALGDRHSTTSIGQSGRIWYAGAPEPTRFTEIAAGNVLVVELTPGRCDAQTQRVGAWRFLARDVEVLDEADVDALESWLDGCDDAARTIVRLRLGGMVPLRTMARLTDVLDAAAERFACVDVHGLHTDLLPVADEDDVAGLDTGPVTRSTIEELQGLMSAGGEEGALAAQAMEMLYRIARRAA